MAGTFGMSDDMRARYVVNGRCCHVHEQHRKRDAVGIRAPLADAKNQEADTDAVNKAALRARGRRDRVRCDKERAQYRCARKQVKAGTCIRARVDKIHDCCGRQQTDENACRYLPADDLVEQQPEAADRDEVADPLPAAAAEITHQRIGADLGIGPHVAQSRLHRVQRRRATDGVEGQRVRQ